jgi:hypothetical protein
MKNLIKHVSGFMKEEDANYIYEYAKKYDNEFLDYGNSEKEFTVHTYHTIEKNDPNTLNLLQVYAKNVYGFVLNNYDIILEPFLDAKTHIARFESGKGMHEHFDSSRPNDIATLIYLNDNYQGGEIYFPEYNIYIKPKIGDLIAFPDNPNFIHGVKEITSGVRYTAPRWFTSIV